MDHNEEIMKRLNIDYKDVLVRVRWRKPLVTFDKKKREEIIRKEGIRFITGTISRNISRGKVLNMKLMPRGILTPTTVLSVPLTLAPTP